MFGNCLVWAIAVNQKAFKARQDLGKALETFWQKGKESNGTLSENDLVKQAAQAPGLNKGEVKKALARIFQPR